MPFEMLRLNSLKNNRLKGRSGTSEVALLLVAFQASPWRSHPGQFALGHKLTIIVTKAQHRYQPPKRRRALLASNPLRNRRLETHRNHDGATGTPPLSHTQHRCDRFPHASKNARRELHTTLRYPQIPLKSLLFFQDLRAGRII